MAAAGDFHQPAKESLHRGTARFGAALAQADKESGLRGNETGHVDRLGIASGVTTLTN